MTGEVVNSKRQQAKDILMKYVHMIPYVHFPQGVAVDIENVVDCLIDAAIEEIKQFTLRGAHCDAVILDECCKFSEEQIQTAYAAFCKKE